MVSFLLMPVFGLVLLAALTSQPRGLTGLPRALPLQPAALTRVPPQLGDSLAPALIARGDSIFSGKLAKGICYSCHGMDARGITSLGPSLRDSVWLHGDGGYAFILRVVGTGIPRPKHAIAPMLPMGGTRLTPDQQRAVAAYVLSLSRNR